MEPEERLEEALERLWIRTFEEGCEVSYPEDLEGGGLRERLLALGHVIQEGEGVKLTAEGEKEAAVVVRRHRLAERLLTDVLATTSDAVIHDKACKFEHLLDRGLDENICTLLGHPKLCPHGKSILPGKCCLEGQKQPQKVVSPLAQLSPRQGGRIAYIYAPQSQQLNKLMGLGLLPGASVRLAQSFPSYVVELGQTRVALDGDIAAAIYVRLESDEKEESLETNGRWGLFRRRRKGADRDAFRK